MTRANYYKNTRTHEAIMCTRGGGNYVEKCPRSQKLLALIIELINEILFDLVQMYSIGMISWSISKCPR